MKNAISALITAGLLLIGVCSAPAPAADNSAATACEALKNTNFSTIQDAPTRVTETRMVEAAGEVPATCVVIGYVVPQVGFKLRLPTSGWNGSFIQIGSGGYSGSLEFMQPWCDDALRRGYACLRSDSGHTASHIPDAISKAEWAYNNLQAEIDYGFRAVHVSALAGQAITQRYYGRAPKFSYFMGCSNGGREALIEAQRFPWDFDGIVAMDAAFEMSTTGMQFLWNLFVTTGSDGKPLLTDADVDVLHQAVLAKCDALGDGIRDGIIGDPRACQFDPAELLCRTGQTSSCLSQAQVEAVRKVYRGPVTSKGERLTYGATPGSENGYYFRADLSKNTPDYKADYWRYMGFLPDPGPNWQATDFDFDTDYKRADMMERIYSAWNPDLSRFKAAGGKLMIIYGWDDSGTARPRQAIDYYEMVERVMGGRANTQDFARLFMLPGRSHCGIVGPDAGANAFDFLGALGAWVEKGRAPDRLIGAHIGKHAGAAAVVRLPKDLSAAKFTRPIYPYPLQYRYKGAGDPNDYRNFEPVEP